MNVNASEFVPRSAPPGAAASASCSGGTASDSPSSALPSTSKSAKDDVNRPRSHRDVTKNASLPGPSSPSSASMSLDTALAIQLGATHLAPKQPRNTGTHSLSSSSSASSAARNKRGEVSLNHLLGFSFPARPQATAPVVRRRRDVYYEPFNKERFVNANFRFVVKAECDYTVQLTDSDVPVNWSDIAQIIIPETKDHSCPICLRPPQAARVAKCGHVYCWPCLLHYLHLGDKKWRKCPICYDAIYKADLKSVKFQHQDVVKVNQDIGMVLMRRRIQSSFSVPRTVRPQDYRQISGGGLRPYSVLDEQVAPYSRILLASGQYIEKICLRDMNELQAMLDDIKSEREVMRLMREERGLPPLKEDGISSEEPFVEIALHETQVLLEEVRLKNQIRSKAEQQLKAVTARELKLAEAPPKTRETTKLNAEDSGQRAQESVDSYCRSKLEDDGYQDPFSDDDGTSSPGISGIFPVDSHGSVADAAAASSSATTDDSGQRAAQCLESPSKPRTGNAVPSLAARNASVDEFYHYYQHLLGQHVYLHPLDIRVLKTEHGGYDRMPDSIKVTIESVSETTINEDMRKKFKYLAHLPQGCDVSFCEVDLASLVSESTYHLFEKDIRERTRRRRAKEHKEESTRKKNEADELAVFMGYTPSTKKTVERWDELDWDSEFPTVSKGSDSDADPGEHHGYSSSYQSAGSHLESDGGESTGTSRSRHSPRYAEISNRPAPPVRPSGKSFASIAGDIAKNDSGWRRNPSAPYGVGASDDDDLYSGHEVGWELDLEEAMLQTQEYAASGSGLGRGKGKPSNTRGNSLTDTGSGNQSEGSKKKKGSKVVVMTNSARRRR
ncbi:uncharacterized protein BJ171DRAFT_522703 [Polychytrium aggregatum]|uniref:uncharacterized protein n=1 Tax=Polychytrium aggregatum TaxID=110093 RepID=UPI0022FDBBB6|nr:uncharacterized protein BJ171DRAFT_522703 [Polychytrium aggregatum]KAI9197112.1 hypothetical protein BJ171DRAFT_522703 [Polychytrium aggregatum]